MSNPTTGLYYNTLTFAGTDLTTFNALVVHRAILGSPARTYTKVNIPGRNGVKYIDEGTFGNVTQSYTLIIQSDFWTNYNALKNYLLSVSNYARLEEHLVGNNLTDGYYMMARVTGLSPKADRELDYGYVIVTFDRLPQKWLTAGETDISVTSGIQVENTTYFEAKPILRVIGTGRIQFQNVAGTEIYANIRVDSYPTTGQGAISYIDIDSELQDCYCGDINCNPYVTFITGEYPVLKSGKTKIVFGSDSSFTITMKPRWWTL